MSDDAKFAGEESAKAIQDALESVERLEQEGGDDTDPGNIQILRPSEAPPSGDPSGEGFHPPDPDLEQQFEGMGEQSLEGEAVGEEEIFLSEESAEEVSDAAPKRSGKSPEAAMLEAMILAKQEAVAVLAQTQLEAKSLQERLVRVSADYENFKKRQAREKEDAVKFANERLLKELLPVMDNMDRARDVAKKSNDEAADGAVKSVIDGVEMVLKQLGDALGRFGIEPFSALGAPFDPAHHEAVAQREDEDAAAGTVIEEYQRGYLLHGRLVRPAMVVVSAGSTPASANVERQEEQAEQAEQAGGDGAQRERDEGDAGERE